jgi:hypothetical protein
MDSRTLKTSAGICKGAGVLAVALAALAAPLSASDCCDPKSPFRAGEGHAETSATCQNLRYWAGRAPQTSERVSMTVRGELSAVHWNGVLAYLEMCDPKGLRVVCVTYATNDMRAGDVVTFGGGYASAGKEWVVLDPCLASR